MCGWTDGGRTDGWTDGKYTIYGKRYTIYGKGGDVGHTNGYNATPHTHLVSLSQPKESSLCPVLDGTPGPYPRYCGLIGAACCMGIEQNKSACVAKNQITRI